MMDKPLLLFLQTNNLDIACASCASFFLQWVFCLQFRHATDEPLTVSQQMPHSQYFPIVQISLIQFNFYFSLMYL